MGVTVRLRSLRSLAAAGGLALLALAPPAWAANFGSNTTAYLTPARACDATTGPQCIANNGLHSYFLSAVEPNQATATRSTCTSDRHSSDTASCLYPNSATSGVLTTHDISELNFHYEIPQ